MSEFANIYQDEAYPFSERQYEILRRSLPPEIRERWLRGDWIIEKSKQWTPPLRNLTLPQYHAFLSGK